MLKNFLITGASGILGTEIIKQLLENDCEYNLFLLSTSKDRLKKLYENYKNVFCYGWGELDALNNQNLDVAVHCAFARNENGEELTHSLELTECLMKYLTKRDKAVPTINISSRSVYGQNPTTPWCETTQVSPNSLYAMAKVSQEMIVKEYSEANKSHYIIIRLAGLVGPGMEQRIVNKLVVQALEKGELNVIGGAQQFAMLHVKDAAAGIIKVLDTDSAKWKSVYNLGQVKNHSLLEIAKLVADIGNREFNLNIKLHHEDKEVTLLDQMDSTLFYSQFDWKPKLDLAQIITALFQSHINRKKCSK